MIELLWLGLIALPVIAVMMWIEGNILRGEWLKDTKSKPQDKEDTE